MEKNTWGYGETHRWATYLPWLYDYVPTPYVKLDIIDYLNKVKVKLEQFLTQAKT